jgi:rhodanese-related sulfurtransferase
MSISTMIIIALFVGAGMYLLYKKGLIFANFKSIAPKSAYTMIKNDPDSVVLDVRTPREYKEDGHLKDAILIPVQELEKELDRLEKFKDKKLLVYCNRGFRSASASRILADRGYQPFNIIGGITAWKDEALPLSNEPL